MRLQRLVVGFLGAALLGAVPVALTATSAEAGAASRRGSSSTSTGQVRLQVRPEDRHPPAPSRAYAADGALRRLPCPTRLGRRISRPAGAQGRRHRSGRPSAHGVDDGRRSRFSPTRPRAAPSTASSTTAAPTARLHLRVRQQGPHRPRARATRTARASSPAAVSTTAATWTRAGAASRSPSRRRTASPAAGAATRPCAPAARAATAPASTRRPAAVGTSARS